MAKKSYEALFTNQAETSYKQNPGIAAEA